MLNKEEGIMGPFREFAKCRSLTTMGLGMLIGASFLHVVSAFVKQLVLPIITQDIHNDSILTMPHLMLTNGGLLHTVIVFLIVTICSYYFLKWSNKLNAQ